MGTTLSIAGAFDAVEKQVKDADKKARKAREGAYESELDRQKALQDKDFAEREITIKEAEIRAKEEIFEAEKQNLLAAKIASTRARLGAGGISGTPGSQKAYEAALAQEAAQKIKENAYFADLDLKKLELAADKAAAKANLVAPADKRPVFYFGPDYKGWL